MKKLFFIACLLPFMAQATGYSGLNRELLFVYGGVCAIILVMLYAGKLFHFLRHRTRKFRLRPKVE